jgi:hypothetical protein
VIWISCWIRSSSSIPARARKESGIRVLDAAVLRPICCRRSSWWIELIRGATSFVVACRIIRQTTGSPRRQVHAIGDQLAPLNRHLLRHILHRSSLLSQETPYPGQASGLRFMHIHINHFLHYMQPPYTSSHHSIVTPNLLRLLPPLPRATASRRSDCGSPGLAQTPAAALRSSNQSRPPRTARHTPSRTP